MRTRTARCVAYSDHLPLLQSRVSRLSETHGAVTQVSYGEFRRGLETLGFMPTEEQFEELLRIVDECVRLYQH